MKDFQERIQIIYTQFNLIDFSRLSKLISDLDLILIGVIITIFVLTVTFLGRAAKLARDIKTETEQKSKQEFDKEISLLQQKVKDSPDDLESLKQQISELEEKKKYTVDQLNLLEKKYNALGLKESVLLPGTLFLLSLIFGNWVILISGKQSWECASFLLALIFLVCGVNKIISALRTISDVSLNTDDHQFKQLENALTQALKTVESDKEPRPVVKFIETPPFVFKANSSGEIKFEIDLLLPGNPEAKNVDVWFLCSPELILLKEGNSAEPFKQKDTYTIPNANTIRYKYNLVRKHTRYHGIIRLKTTVAGSFKMRYKADCDNHVESINSEKEIGIIVKD